MSEHRLDFYMNYFGLLTNIFLLAYQLSAISLLRVIDNGLGDAVFGGVVDYAHLAADQKSSVPSQGQKPLEHLKVISVIMPPPWMKKGAFKKITLICQFGGENF